MAQQNQEENPSATTCSDSSHINQCTADHHMVLRQRTNPNTGILDEQVLCLVFRHLNWDPQTLCSTACTSRRLRAVAERVLFFELCLSRAPRLVSSLVAACSTLPLGKSGSAPRIPGGWSALAKLLLFCCGCKPSRFFPLSNAVPGHFVAVSRFSKTSGQSFLLRRFWGDLLYVSDPCEHGSPAEEDQDLGAYRGVFCGFMRSHTRACLVERNVKLETQIRCPYCGARVWSMSGASLIPKHAARRLGSQVNRMEYFVCVYGHLHGSCWLARLSSDDDDTDDESNDDDERDDEPDGDKNLT
ncbi:hypothetical protein LUZ61_002964 [Rhynchospora tenuis]|uniref:F-box domain-containing protein n=1 Tax=Rhynchospora tenuis TaxID=198213 RepID=A0AAD5ZJW0_9POAL|nr:hypothetical protein LUZ61_002964 [Rhynchospora tenuis]